MKVFSDIYRERRWGGESASGPGSGSVQAQVLGPSLRDIVKRFGIRSIVDAACGDFNWMHSLALPVHTYYGVDVVPELIDENRRVFGQRLPQQSFWCEDITKAALPALDLILCRDCLMHLSNVDALSALHRFAKSGCKYLLATTFRRTSENIDITTGGWRAINLELEPFSLPVAEFYVDDWFPNQRYRGDKSLGLWLLSEVRLTQTETGESL